MAEFLAPFWEFLFDKLGIFGLLIAGSVPVILIILLIGFIGIISRIRKAAKARKIKKLRRKIQTAIDDEEYETAFDLWQALGNQTPLTGDEQYRVGKLCEAGAASDWDKSGKPFEAITWYEKAAGQGHLSAKYEVAMHRHNLAVEKNDIITIARMNDEIRALAAKKCPEAIQRAEVFDKEIKRLLEQKPNGFLKLAAIFGSMESRMLVVYMIFELKEEDRYKEAMQWLDLAAQARYKDAQYFYGRIHLFGQYGVKKDEKKGLEWIEKAAYQDHVKAQALAGIAYANEDSKYYSPTKALSWSEQAAKNGDPDAMFMTSKLYSQKGQDAIRRDDATAVSRYSDKVQYWTEKAAEHGHEEAIKMMAAWEEETKDINTALQYIQKELDRRK